MSPSTAVLPDQPSQPINLAVSAFGPNWVLLGWINVGGVSEDNVSWGFSCSSFVQNVTVSPGMGPVSFNVTGLDSTLTYCFGVASYVPGPPPNMSAPVTVTATTLPFAPAAPNVISLNVSTITIGWGAPANSPDTTGYTVYYGSACGSWAPGIPVSNVTHSYEFTGLSSASPYCFAVSAMSAGGSGALSPGTGATTLPSAPTGLSLSDITESTMTLTWSNPPGILTANTVAWGIETVTKCKDFTSLRVGLTTTYTVTGLTTGTFYCLGVSAWSAGGQGPAEFTNESTASVPGKPTGLAIISATTDSIAVNWTNPIGPIVNLTLFYSLEVSSGTCGGAAAIALPGAPDVWNVTGLSDNSTYCIQVVAFNSTGMGALSDVLLARTLGPPWSPYHLKATQSAILSFALSWTNRNTTAVVNNSVYEGIETGSGCVGFTLYASGIPANSSGTGSYSIAVTADNTTYCFAVASGSSVGSSPMSVPITASVGGPPFPVYGLASTSVGPTFVVLTWTLNSAPTGALTNLTVYFGATCGPPWASNQSTAGAITTSWNVTNLSPQTDYCFNVAAWNAYGHSTVAAGADYTVTTLQPRTGGIAGLTVSLVSSDTITIAWTNPSGTINNTVFMGVQGTSGCGPWTQAISTHGPVESYAFGDLSPATKYCFAVIAWSQFGPSVPSELQTSTVSSNGTMTFSLPLWAYVAIAIAVVAALVIADLVVRRGWSPLRRRPRGPPPGAIHTWGPEKSPTGEPAESSAGPPTDSGH